MAKDKVRPVRGYTEAELDAIASGQNKLAEKKAVYHLDVTISGVSDEKMKVWLGILMERIVEEIDAAGGKVAGGYNVGKDD
jgi:hypothetical protein